MPKSKDFDYGENKEGYLVIWLNIMQMTEINIAAI